MRTETESSEFVSLKLSAGFCSVVDRPRNEHSSPINRSPSNPTSFSNASLTKTTMSSSLKTTIGKTELPINLAICLRGTDR
jgi:hypothetical protein